MWGESLGSYEYYIKAEQEKAARMDAPTDALYFKSDFENPGSWICVSHLRPAHHFRVAYEKAVLV